MPITKQFLRPTLLLMIAFSALVSTGCTVNDRSVINQATEAHNTLEAAVITDPELTGYLQAVGERIIKAAYQLDKQGDLTKTNRSEDDSWMYSNAMKFHLVNSKTLNAFTTGGEHMYIYTQLMVECKNEDELAGVMAHEYAHIYARHVKKGMERQYKMLGLAAVAAVGGAVVGGKDNWMEGAALGGAVGYAGGQFLGMGFTRKDEDEADKLGFMFYTRAGWDPERFAGFFQTMIDKGYDTTPEMMSDHPSLKGRVASTARRIEELPAGYERWQKPNVADDARFKYLQQRALNVGASMPRDKSMEAAGLMFAAFPSCVAPVDQPSQVGARQELIRDAKSR